MRRSLSRSLGVALGLLLLLQTSPLHAQDLDWREKFKVVERLMSELIPRALRPDLKTRWEVIAENARVLREASSAPLGPGEKAALDALEETEDRNRRAASSTISSSRNEGLENWKRADALVREYVEKGLPITKERLLAINTELRRQNGTNGVYAGGRNQSLAVPDAHTDEAIDSFMKWFEKAEKKMNPVELAARAYQRLVTIHPLQDANGRTSRMLMEWVLRRAGLPAVALDHAVATGAISDPFVFHGTEEQYTGRPLKVIENLTANLERGIRTRLEALGRVWDATPPRAALADGLPSPEKVRAAARSKGAALDKALVAAAASRERDARGPRTGVVRLLDERVRDGTSKDAIRRGGR